jgi:DNA-binding MarR family transcriptional regulator
MYICIVKLEQAIQSNKFKNQRHKVGLNILYTAWWMKSRVNTELKEFGLTHEQYNVLRILNGKHPEQMCVKDIAGRMIEKSSNVPRIVDKLDLKNLIKRAQGEIDGRQTMISLTHKGLDILLHATKRIDALQHTMTALTEEEANQLNMLLEKMREND